MIWIKLIKIDILKAAAIVEKPSKEKTLIGLSALLLILNGSVGFIKKSEILKKILLIRESENKIHKEIS